LVDGCYSLWQGGLFPLLLAHMPLLLRQLRPCRVPAAPVAVPAVFDAGEETAGAAQLAARLFPVPQSVDTGQPPALYNAAALQGWLLACCQARDGGLRDKPGKARDLYHTCYCLSGLSSAQHHGCVLGAPGNLLARTDAVVNVVVDRLVAWDALLACA
jgi:protein farnesyltransferase subunit beta